jgi:uncharacterized FlgJ-related protein
MNVDAEIYLKQLFGFFDSNPESLHSLIGELSRDKFYEKIRTSVYDKVEKEEDIVLSKKQMIDIIKDLWDETNGPTPQVNIEIIDTFFKTNYGFFSLN